MPKQGKSSKQQGFKAASGRGGKAAGKVGSGRPGAGKAGAGRPAKGKGGRFGFDKRGVAPAPKRPRSVKAAQNTQTVRIEGRRAVAEALDAKLPIKRALVQMGASEDLSRLMGRLAEAQVPVEAVPKAMLDDLSSHGAHQGIVIELSSFAYTELGDLIRAAQSKKEPQLVLVLDHVTDEGNFGAIVRSAEIAGAAGVVIANARAATVGTGAMKTSAGAVLHVPIAQVPNVARAVEELKSAGFWCVAASEHANHSIWDAPLTGNVAVIMGSEGSGVSQLVLKTVDDTCALPQRGRIESLNVAQAATVFCYEWMRANAQEIL